MTVFVRFVAVLLGEFTQLWGVYDVLRLGIVGVAFMQGT